MNRQILFCFIGFSFLFAACSAPKVEKQSVPISSVPLGADVYANGKHIGITPIAVDLEKNRHHQITLSKSGYIPQNVTVLSVQDKQKYYEKALAEGLNSGIFFKDPTFGIASARNSMESNDETGACHNLEPACVNVQLVSEKN